MPRSPSEKNLFKPFTLILLSLTICFAAKTARAQIVNGDFNNGNAGITTSYTYIPSGTSTTPGTFGVRTNSQDFNPGYTAFTDHSGTGGMMLVDGDANITVWQQSVPVTPNTNYAFVVWATPANGSNPAVLDFKINGVQQGPSLTLSGTPGVWVQTTIVWNSGAATTAVLAISDENGVSLGNDFALDDISFTPTANGNVVTSSIYTAVEINWSSQINQAYQVQYRTNVNSSTWFNFGATVQGNGTNNSVFDTTRGQPAKFYRVITSQ